MHTDSNIHNTKLLHNPPRNKTTNKGYSEINGIDNTTMSPLT